MSLILNEGLRGLWPFKASLGRMEREKWFDFFQKEKIVYFILVGEACPKISGNRTTDPGCLIKRSPGFLFFNKV